MSNRRSLSRNLQLPLGTYEPTQEKRGTQYRLSLVSCVLCTMNFQFDVLVKSVIRLTGIQYHLIFRRVLISDSNKVLT